MAGYDAYKLTWAALLARWVEFARSAVALPDDASGRRMKDSVADLIALQAVACALGELDRLDAGERSLGIDRASVLVQKHSVALEERFGGQMPRGVSGLIEDARGALERAMVTRNRG